MLAGDMAIENFAGLPDFEDLPKNMQVEIVDGFVVIPDETHENHKVKDIVETETIDFYGLVDGKEEYIATLERKINKKC